MGPYIARNVEKATGKSVGEGRYKGQCVALVQVYGRAPNTARWSAGLKIEDAKPGMIERYTCIATFVDGVYLNRSSGNHAAVYISHDAGGIHVYDQWSKRPVGTRYIRFKGAGDNGSASNNGSCFYVIM